MAETAELDTRPVLFFNIGVQGSIPIGFDKLFAREFALHQFSRSKLANNISARKKDYSDRRAVSRHNIDSYFATVAIPLLEDGESVYANMSYNTVTTRQHPLPFIARKTGSVLVALNVMTPKTVIEERIKEIAEAQRSKGRKRNFARFDLASLRAIERPTIGEPIEHLLTLNGSEEAEGLLGQVTKQLAQARLLVGSAAMSTAVND